MTLMLYIPSKVPSRNGSCSPAPTTAAVRAMALRCWSMSMERSQATEPGGPTESSSALLPLPSSRTRARPLITRRTMSR
jgi:hypothetical protein